MKEKSYYFCFFCLFLVACAPVHYQQAPKQNLKPPKGNTSPIDVINKSGGTIEFIYGDLEGLILAPWDKYEAKISWGFRGHCWLQEFYYNRKTKKICTKIAVNYNSRIIIIHPPRRCDLFYTRCKGSWLEVR